ncbi:uncharacterized protein LOC110435347 [Sorghum bicolor]|uniref:uncharacterized protein LOC110435347 n=1 Tax=Sorghum bicolor TaxID=4558 RepID=UPI000B426709|nr:uncharacterized protein LOC110435347 [Sorghum bicolor]|eukprot:XP_021316488.1 uncharacterized protein LOC110435347 [Sorghum bicolor]
MAGSKRGHNSRYQARNERGQFAVKIEVYYISSDDDVAPAGTPSAGANRVREVVPSKFKKTRTTPPVKGGKGKGQASTVVKKKGNPTKKTSKPSPFESDTSSYDFYTDSSDDSSDDLADLFEKAMGDIDRRMDKLYRTVKKRFFPND